MDKGKNNKWFLKCLMIMMAIISFICLSVLTFKTQGLADITLNPYCPSDTGRIEELTEDFIVKYGEENVRIDWSESTGIPERIHIYSREPFVIRYPEIPYSWETSPTMVEIWASTYRSNYITEAKEFALSFLSENSVFLGINVNELEFSKTNVGSKNAYAKVIYNQVYKDVPVDGGSLYVLVDSEENPSGEFRLIINSSDYYPCIDVDVAPNISEEEAESVVLEDRGVTELFNLLKIPVGSNSIFYEYVSEHFPHIDYWKLQEVEIPAITKLVIYLKGSNAYLCWKFVFNLGDRSHYWYYYIDAHTGDITYKSQSFPIAGSPSDETESEDSEKDTTSQNTDIINSYPPGFYISPLYQMIPWISSPIDYHYGLANSNPSFTLPWEQGYAYMWATRGASWNQPYNYGWNSFNYTWNQPYNYGYKLSSGKNNFYNYPYFSGYYDDVLPYDGSSTYFHLLSPDSILWSDPYTLAIMASQ